MMAAPKRSEPPAILFVCRENACRSQIAEAFARALGGSRIVAYSAGSSPRGQVDARAMEVMKERRISLDGHRSKGIPDLPARTWDVVVGMGCGDACPQVSAARRVEWEIPDPAGTELPAYRRVRDTIEAQVKELLRQVEIDFIQAAG